jgi:hypothetical protein
MLTRRAYQEGPNDAWARHIITNITCRSPPLFRTGGVVCMSKAGVEKVRGWPNDIWGWGLEDLCMEVRIHASGIAITEPSMADGLYDCLDLTSHTKRVAVEGYNTVHRTLEQVRRQVEHNNQAAQKKAGTIMGNLDSLKYTLKSSTCFNMTSALEKFARSPDNSEQQIEEETLPAYLRDQGVIHLLVE